MGNFTLFPLRSVTCVILSPFTCAIIRSSSLYFGSFLNFFGFGFGFSSSSSKNISFVNSFFFFVFDFSSSSSKNISFVNSFFFFGSVFETSSSQPLISLSTKYGILLKSLIVQFFQSFNSFSLFSSLSSTIVFFANLSNESLLVFFPFY